MRKISQRLKDASADRKTSFALARSEGALNEAQLEQVAAAGGKTGASTNPVED